MAYQMQQANKLIQEESKHTRKIDSYFIPSELIR
jgi:hypothetical protein